MLMLMAVVVPTMTTDLNHEVVCQSDVCKCYYQFKQYDKSDSNSCFIGAEVKKSQKLIGIKQLFFMLTFATSFLVFTTGF